MLKATLAQEIGAARGVRLLWLYGLSMAGILLAFAWRYPLAAHSGGLADIGTLSRYQPVPFAGYVAGMTALFGMYLLAVRASRRLPSSDGLRPVFGSAVLMALGMEWMYPVSATDIYIYATRSRLLTTYGVNPIGVPFSNYPNDAWAAFITPEWAGRLSPYGPLWNLIAAPITALAGDQIIIALVGFKLLMVAGLLVSGWAIVRALAALGRDDGATGALLYLWNPLVLWEGIGNGHNDMLVALGLLLALWAWAARRNGWVIPLLVLAAMVKYVTLPFIPLAAIALWRRAGERAVRLEIGGWTLILSTGAVLLSLFPFYNLGAIRASMAQQGTLFYSSPAAMLLALLDGRVPAEQLRPWITWTGAAALLVALAWQARVVWRWPERLPRACFELLYVLLLLATWNLRPWYGIWLVGLAALLPWGWPAWRAIAWTIGGLASYALLIWIEAWWQPGFNTMQIMVVPVMLGASLLLTLAELLARRSLLGSRS